MSKNSSNTLKVRDYINVVHDVAADSSLVDLSSQLVAWWVPYYDCGKCGRSDYCKYACPVDEDYNRFEEIRCGVVSTFIVELCSYSDKEYLSLNPERKQSFIDFLCCLQKFAYDAESYIGLFQKKNNAERGYADLLGLGLLGVVSEIKEGLIKACSFARDIELVKSNKIMLLVEGQAEKVFIEALIPFYEQYIGDIVVESYEGESNKTKSKVFLLMNYFKAKGYKVLIQIDLDGKPGLTESNHYGLQDHIRSGLISPDDYFGFRFDLESAYPSNLLAHCLHHNYGLSQSSLEGVLGQPNDGAPLYKRLDSQLDFLPTKPMLAESMANLIGQHDLIFAPHCSGSEIELFFNFLKEQCLKLKRI